MSTSPSPPARPTNILLITLDDMDAGTPGAFGGPAGVTPRIDALAAEGMTFQRAHVAAAVCQPSRSSIMTGRWPHRNGAEGFGPVRDDVPVLTALLAQRGYRCGILGKVDHLQPVARFGWDTVVGMRDLGMGRDPERYGGQACRFFDQARDQDRPWFLMANAHDPHRPFHGSVDERSRWSEQERASYPWPSAGLDIEHEPPPGFLPDLPAVRQEFHEYLASCRRADDVVAAVLAALDTSGQADRTLVLFLSDNGMAFPFAKANCYLRSTLTPFIVRWPGVVEPGSVVPDAFVSMLDLFPTVCDLLGMDPGEVDGRSLLPLLTGTEQGLPAHRDRVFSVFHETAMKRRLEMRCVQDARWGYIWNAWSDGATAYRAENMMGLTWGAMEAAARTDPEIAARVAFYRNRVPEELYDLRNDPHALVNLAGSAEHVERLAEARRTLAGWLAEVSDPLSERYAAEIDIRRPT